MTGPVDTDRTRRTAAALRRTYPLYADVLDATADELEAARKERDALRARLAEVEGLLRRWLAEADENEAGCHSEYVTRQLRTCAADLDAALNPETPFTAWLSVMEGHAAVLSTTTEGTENDG